MTENRFSPPKTEVEIAATPKPKAPLSVRITQLLGTALSAAFILGIYRASSALLSHTGTESLWLPYGMAITWRVASTVFLIAMITALQRRLKLGKPMALSFIVALYCTLVYREVTQPPEKQNAIAMAFASMLWFYWGYASTWSAKARRYFGGER